MQAPNPAAVEQASGRSTTRQFHLLCLYAIFGAVAFAFSPLWLGPILSQLAQVFEQWAWFLARSPVMTWAAMVSASVVVSYLLSLVLLLEHRQLMVSYPRQRAALLGLLAVVAAAYVALYAAAPQLPLQWWVEFLVARLHATTPVWLAQAVVLGFAGLAHLAALYLGSVAIVVFLVTTCAAPKQVEL